MEWISNKTGEFVGWIAKGGLRGIGRIGNECTGIFIIIAIIGVYITMSGNKKLGTKITSLDFMVYIILKAFSNV